MRTFCRRLPWHSPRTPTFDVRRRPISELFGYPKTYSHSAVGPTCLQGFTQRNAMSHEHPRLSSSNLTMITLTLIRHGESEDNLTNNWAGWKNAPLSSLGEQQADALGVAFNASSTRFQHFYSSDLSRAHSTALAVIKHHSNPKPPLLATQTLREQHFGVAEGRTWTRSAEDKPVEELYAEGIFPQLRGRDAKFPEGECLNDVARRAEDAIRECILPHVLNSTQDSASIGLASHGLFLSEIIPALLRLDPDADSTRSYRGHFNTAWSRFKISVRDGYKGEYDVNSPPPLRVQLIAFNSCKHLDSLLPTAPVNEEARAFFSGITVSA